MVAVLISRSMAVVALVGLAGTAAQAASEVDVGGFQDQVAASAQQDLLGATAPSAPQLQIEATPAPFSALTAFTPRVGGLGLAIAGRQHSQASLLLEDEETQPQRLQIGLSDSADIAGWEVGLSATADVGRPATVGGDGGSALMVGGQLAVSGLRFDASVGRDASLLGESARQVTAGVGYDFGRLDTRMSYSLVESEQRATTTGLLTLGSEFELSSNLTLNGDLAIADEEDGAATTAGRVSLRLNF
jgi:hypothetical protein